MAGNHIQPQHTVTDTLRRDLDAGDIACAPQTGIGLIAQVANHTQRLRLGAGSHIGEQRQKLGSKHTAARRGETHFLDRGANIAVGKRTGARLESRV